MVFSGNENPPYPAPHAHDITWTHMPVNKGYQLQGSAVRVVKEIDILTLHEDVYWNLTCYLKENPDY